MKICLYTEFRLLCKYLRKQQTKGKIESMTNSIQNLINIEKPQQTLIPPTYILI